MNETSISRFRKLSHVTLTVLLLIMVSCVKDNFDFDRFSDRISYKPSFVVPAAKGSLTIGNLLESDEELTITYDSDSVIILSIIEDSLFSVSVEEILEIPDPDPVVQNFQIDPVAISDFQTATKLSLGSLAERMPILLYDAIIALDGTTSVFPAIDQSLGVFNVNPFDEFEYATFSQGTLNVELFNELPFALDIEVNIFSESDGGVQENLGTLVFTNLGSGVTLDDQIDLTDKLVYSDVKVEMVTFRTGGSDGPVEINIQDGLFIDASCSDGRIRSGKAIIPPTDLSSESSDINLPFDDANIEIQTLKLKEGTIDYSIPDIMEGVVIEFSIANSDKSGQPFSETVTMHGTGSTIYGSIDLGGVEFDFSGQPNVLLFEYTVSVGSPDVMLVFEIPAGGLDISMEFGGLGFDYATGYFGNEEIALEDEEITLDIFEDIEGSFWFENPSIKLNYKNSVGVPVNLAFNLQGEAPGKEPIKLFPDVHPGFDINHPDDLESPPYEGVIVIDSSTNIREVISMPPSSIKFNAGASINPDGPGTPNFISSESLFQIGMEIVMPLDIKFEDLGLTDTVEVDFEPDDIDDILEQLIMTIDVTNGLPLGVELDIILYDAVNDLELDTRIFEDEAFMIEAASVGPDGMVLAGGESESSVEVIVTGSKIDDLRQTTHFIVSAYLNTGKHQDVQVPVKIQNYNKLDFRIRFKADLNIE